MGKYTDQMIGDKLGIAKKNIIKNGTTTVVYGETSMKESLAQKVAEAVSNVVQKTLIASSKVIVTRGVSKLHPGDKYDEKTGIHLASRKAELKGRIKYCNQLADAYNASVKLLDILEEEMKKEEVKLKNIVNDINEQVETVEAKA